MLVVQLSFSFNSSMVVVSYNRVFDPVSPGQKGQVRGGCVCASKVGARVVVGDCRLPFQLSFQCCSVQDGCHSIHGGRDVLLVHCVCVFLLAECCP